MSILAADQKAMAQWPGASASEMTVVRNYKKIKLNSNGSLALGTAGQTQDHYYLQAIEQSANIYDWFSTIQKHLEGFLRFHDRSSLLKLPKIEVNEGIASFFDRDTDSYFTHTFLFSPVESQTRLHGPIDGVKIFRAGSGGKHFENAVGSANIESFIASTKNLCTPETCIPWMRDAYRKVSESDADSGGEPVFVVSTRSEPNFRFI